MFPSYWRHIQRARHCSGSALALVVVTPNTMPEAGSKMGGANVFDCKVDAEAGERGMPQNPCFLMSAIDDPPPTGTDKAYYLTRFLPLTQSRKPMNGINDDVMFVGDVDDRKMIYQAIYENKATALVHCT